MNKLYTLIVHGAWIKAVQWEEEQNKIKKIRFCLSECVAFAEISLDAFYMAFLFVRWNEIKYVCTKFIYVTNICFLSIVLGV